MAIHHQYLFVSQFYHTLVNKDFSVGPVCSLEARHQCCRERSQLEKLVMSRLPSFYLVFIVGKVQEFEEEEVVTRHQRSPVVPAIHAEETYKMGDEGLGIS